MDGNCNIGEIYEGDFSSHFTVNILPQALNILYNTDHPSMIWLSKEELKDGKKPDGIATKNMMYWGNRTWIEKN